MECASKLLLANHQVNKRKQLALQQRLLSAGVFHIKGVEKSKTSWIFFSRVFN